MANVPRNPLEHGPYVQVAAICERVLREADGVISLIRIIDVVTHTERGPDPPNDMPEVRCPLTLVIAMKSGRAKGRHDVTITPQLPSGETLAAITVSVQLEGEGKGYHIVSKIDIPYTKEGLYWFNVRFDDELFTRLPLEIRYARMVTGSTSPQS